MALFHSQTRRRYDNACHNIICCDSTHSCVVIVYSLSCTLPIPIFQYVSPGGGGALIFSSYVDLDPASAFYRKYVHEVLVNCLVKLAQGKKCG